MKRSFMTCKLNALNYSIKNNNKKLKILNENVIL